MVSPGLPGTLAAQMDLLAALGKCGVAPCRASVSLSVHLRDTGRWSVSVPLPSSLPLGHQGAGCRLQALQSVLLARGHEGLSCSSCSHLALISHDPHLQPVPYPIGTRPMEPPMGNWEGQGLLHEPRVFPACFSPLPGLPFS